MPQKREVELAARDADRAVASRRSRVGANRLATRAACAERSITITANAQRARQLFVIVAVAFAALLQSARAEDVNHVGSIQAVGSNIEITLTSSRKFPMRAALPTLVIGTQRFEGSRYPADGSMSTLIFILTSSEFQALADGAPMSVDYGVGDHTKT
jgi:hypothetical protein